MNRVSLWRNTKFLQNLGGALDGLPRQVRGERAGAPVMEDAKRMGVVEWSPVQRPPDLPPGEVHVWRTATLSRGGPDDAVLLSPEERMRAERIRRSDERARFIAGRAIVRRVLGAYVSTSPAALVFHYGRFGKPFLAEAHGGGFRFSVTHAGDLLMLAITHGRDVGVDVERLRAVRRHERIAHRHFSAGVCAVLDAIDPPRRALGFLHAWTCLEAHAKARGGGVYATRTHLPLVWPPAAMERVVQEQGPGAEGRVWTLRVLHPADGYVATVVAEGGDAAFRFLEVPSRRA
jgi:4'-phosphopantetheinyl transferase